jgi:hypothetical protein
MKYPLILAALLVAGCSHNDGSCRDQCDTVAECEKCFYGGMTQQEYRLKEWNDFVETCRKTCEYGCPVCKSEDSMTIMGGRLNQTEKWCADAKCSVDGEYCICTPQPRKNTN